MAPVFLLYGRLRLANAGPSLASDGVGVIGPLGDRKGVATATVDHLQRCRVLAGSPGRDYGVLFFVDHSGKAVRRLDNADAVPPEALDDFSRRSGLALRGSWDEAIPLDEVARRFPGAFSRVTVTGNSIAEHPTRTSLIAAGITIVFFVALFVALVIRSGR